MSGRGGGWHLRRHLVAGLIVIAPVFITAYVLWVIFRWLDLLLGRFLYPAIGTSIPGLGLLALLVLLVVVGWIAERALGARMLGWWNALLERIPIARRIYSASNRIVRTVLGEERRFFKDVVLVEYPAEGRWSIGFLTAEAPAAMRERVPGGVTVFIPTTPNPTTGFLAVIPRERVVVLSMTLEDAFTYILSAGAVAPEELVAATPGARSPAPP